MNLDFIRDNFRFNARTSALIYNKDKSKILLFNVEGRDFYMLPGGRIEELEESSDTIKREIKEEIGWADLEFSFSKLASLSLRSLFSFFKSSFSFLSCSISSNNSLFFIL